MKRAPQRAKTWIQVGETLLRHGKSGRYYARFHRNGKPKWIALKTKLRSVAEGRLAEERTKWLAVDPVASDVSGIWTVGVAMSRFVKDIETGKAFSSRAGIQRKGRMTEATQRYRLETLSALKGSWRRVHGNDLRLTELRRLTRQSIEQWADYYRNEVSPSRFNGTLGTFRKIVRYGIEAGQIHRDPTQGIERATVRPTSLNAKLPTREQFEAIIEHIRAGLHRTSQDVADFVELLAYSGSRSNEAASVTWADVDFHRETLRLRVTKNGQVREVPLNHRLRALLERMRKSRIDDQDDAVIVRVSDVRATLDRACKKAGAPRITRHGLRAYFATIALQSGVDPKTLAEWMGHLDGGLLLFTKYAKANQHLLMAARVDFGSLAAGDLRCQTSQAA